MTELSNKRETKPSDDTGNKKPLDFSNVKIENLKKNKNQVHRPLGRPLEKT